MDDFLDEICFLRTTPVASVPPFRAARVPDPDWLPGSPAPPPRSAASSPAARAIVAHARSSSCLSPRARVRDFLVGADLAVKGSVRGTRIDLHCFTYSCICCCRIWDSLHMDTFFCRCSEQQQQQ